MVTILLVAGLLFGLFSVEVSAQEGNETNEVEDYEYEFSDSVRLVDYYETDDGKFEAVFEADRPTSGTYTELTGGQGEYHDFSLEEGRNTIEIDVDEAPKYSFSVDGRWTHVGTTESVVEGPPSGEEWSPVYIVSGVLFSFGSIVAAGLLLFNFIDKITGGKQVFGA
ncbi:hypothetical protein EL22_20015 [Halostagnicola sp. A56]|uniref:hypothetical protein n=1 Tax=Halostagnicola sp. A56 TaxID=1495067 RepID=UPI00065F6AA9|nr:hypothetical protein [Halostagnicola sp. A56]KDE56815.2 hypothetical protein EL22_20015 [Halostagnicola sp. A56]